MLSEAYRLRLLRPISAGVFLELLRVILNLRLGDFLAISALPVESSKRSGLIFNLTLRPPSSF